MARKRLNNRVGWALFGLAFVTGLVAYVQYEADGLRNAVNPKYWADRSKGLDEYEPSEAFFKRGPRDHKVVCITIDDGPHGLCTKQELAALREAHVPAAFFFVGKKMKQHPDLVRMVLAEGMEVGNHTETHPRLSAIPLEKARQEVVACENDFEKITGHRMTLFRPPGMRENPSVLKMVKSLGYQTIGWNVGAHDFVLTKADKHAKVATVGGSPEEIADRVMKQVKNGSIILLHDQPATAMALPEILKSLSHSGYEVVSCAQAMSEIVHPVMVAANPILPNTRVAKYEPRHPISAPRHM